MAAQQKRMLTASTSKLGKIDIVKLLEKDEAWDRLPAEIRQKLYEILPPPKEGESPHDPGVHPLKTRYKFYIQNELHRWQNELREGQEMKKWREEAMQASRDRMQGKFDEWKELQREQDWCLRGKDENSTPKAAVEDLPAQEEGREAAFEKAGEKDQKESDVVSQ